ncbi:MAG: dTDP-4-dehydrorhamnose 3,5-epimerase [Chloroflexi bacterium]|nr:dTDP-4-dehydrorhamnose 3,5-epimerase [Chloroflexota bacterium]
MPFNFHRLRIPDVVLIEARSFGDERGLFRETWKASEFAAAGFDLQFVQDNHSRSVRNVLRGLHFQRPPHAQGKLVFTLSGEIFDVAVDIRTNSPTFGQWVGETLSGDNGRALWVPPGFAHGFVVRSELAHVLYKVTDEYAASCDAGILWNDPALNIDWGVDAPLLSPKDVVQPLLKNIDTGFVY